MDFPMLRQKRPLLDRYEKQPWFYKKRCLKTLWDGQQADRRSCCHPWVCEACTTGKSSYLFEQTSSWADTQHSVNKVLEYLKFNPATDFFFFNDSLNSKFLQFHQDVTDEYGADDKQHSLAAIEKQDEIIMYGPYYPNYSSGKHSEDIIITQTQELLESEGASEDWKVYIFTMNSPCLVRNHADQAEPCMLNLVHKAQEWWRVFGVKTHIGYVKCWGFKGTKENLFKDVNYKQVDCINQNVDYESYIKAAEPSTDFNPLRETVFSLVKRLLSSQQESIPLTIRIQRQDRKTYFKSMHTIFESKPEDEKKILTQEVKALIESAELLLSVNTESFEKLLERGCVFSLDYTFGSQVCDAGLQDQIRRTFQQCWRNMVQDKYAEIIREKLTEDFNHCTVQLFIRDILKITDGYLQIGKVRAFKGSTCC